MNAQYSEKVLDHFMHPRNLGILEFADVKATEGSPACGDQVSLYLKVNPETMIIEDISFQSYGCASNIATASIITEMAKGKTLDEAEKITWKESANALGGLPAVKMHCSVLAVDTLKSAIKKYKIEHNLIAKEKFSKDLIIKELHSVVYPNVGEDIVSLKMVKYLSYDKGVVTIDLDVPSFDPMRDNIAEEVREHLGKFPEIKEIKLTM